MNGMESIATAAKGQEMERTSVQSAIEPVADVSAGHRRHVRLGYLIHDVSRLRRKAFDQLMKPLGVTRSQWWVLANLSRQDGMMQTKLASILDVGKASLGSVLDRLESGGWISRVADPVDRRVKRVLLTKRSHRLIETMDAKERVFNERILSELSGDDRDNLIDSLSRIKKRIAIEALSDDRRLT